MFESDASMYRKADLGDLIRRLRRRADLSQRELAARAGVPQPTIARIESGRTGDPQYRTIERLVQALGGRMHVELAPGSGRDADALAEAAPVPHDEMRDLAGRRYPAHLDVWEVREPRDWPGAWWAEWYRLPPRQWPLPLPPATFRLNREYRNERRNRERVRHSVAVRRVRSGVPRTAWRFAAELPGGELVGELRAHQESAHLRWGDGAGPPKEETVLDGVLVTFAYRRLGIGRRLVAALIDTLGADGAVCLRAVTVQPGVSFLLACGFRLEASRPSALRFEPLPPRQQSRRR
ncbi:GNAT family N-acetyltransferase [Micromonospora marina]|uniref:GNAT family N-acetyltransferase n=1 Tax=Micromonospora marina TaxID=307120 RepID=UPI0034566F94